MQCSPDSPTPLPRASATEFREIALFAGLPDDTLHFLATSLRSAHHPEGGVIFREGDDARELYILLSGQLAEYRRNQHGVDVQIATIHAGHSFGEICVLDVQRRSTTVRATSPVDLLLVTAKDLDALYRRDMKAYALFILNIARDLCRRLQLVNALLADLGNGAAHSQPLT